MKGCCSVKWKGHSIKWYQNKGNPESRISEDGRWEIRPGFCLCHGPDSYLLLERWDAYNQRECGTGLRAMQKAAVVIERLEIKRSCGY